MARIELRIDDSLKHDFIQKIDDKYSGMSDLLKRFIHAYTYDSGFVNDHELTVLLHAVKALNSYTNNINQIAKKVHQTGELEPYLTKDEFTEINDHIYAVTESFRQIIRTRNQQVNSL